MTLLLADQWKALSARIRGIREASTLYLLGTNTQGASSDITIPLASSIRRVFNELQEFQRHYHGALPPAASRALRDFLTNSHSCKNMREKANYWGLQAAMIELCAFEAEFSYCISDREASVQRLVQRAFLHLSRTLVVDPDLSAKWKTALHQEGEVQVEKLGGIHLLAHGIWAFKCSATGERTDLVLGDILSQEQEVAEVATGLVLTEWKVALEASEAGPKWNQALYQAQRYAQGALAGFELRSIRYLVLVTEDHVVVPDDIREDNVTYKHINIAVAPSSPSQTRRQ